MRMFSRRNRCINRLIALVTLGKGWRPRVRHALTRHEYHTRLVMAVPLGHPEWVSPDLDQRSERDLARLCDELWPNDEYTEITLQDWRRREA